MRDAHRVECREVTGVMRTCRLHQRQSRAGATSRTWIDRSAIGRRTCTGVPLGASDLNRRFVSSSSVDRKISNSFHAELFKEEPLRFSGSIRLTTKLVRRPEFPRVVGHDTGPGGCERVRLTRRAPGKSHLCGGRCGVMPRGSLASNRRIPRACTTGATG